MRNTTQLLDHLGLAGWGVLTDNAAQPLAMGDQYVNRDGAPLPDNHQLYSCAEQLIRWWKSLNQTDCLTSVATFRERLNDYAALVENLTHTPKKSVAFQFLTIDSPARTVFTMVWDTNDNTQALFFTLRFPDPLQVAQLKSEAKLWRRDWTPLVQSKGMFGFLYNGQCVVRTNQRWGVLNTNKFPDVIDGME